MSNAAAVIRDRQRYILYNQTWMAAIDREGNTDWEAVSILAHEIGHHLSGHTLVMKAAVPQRSYGRIYFQAMFWRRWEQVWKSRRGR
ncbi:MAG: M48 family metalloprotease [Deinococcales bacterium]